MAITIKRRDKESNERLLRRFSRRVQTSGLLLRTKKRQYHEKVKSHNQVQREALRRLQIRGRIEYLRKIGAWDEETTNQGRGGKSRTKKF